MELVKNKASGKYFILLDDTVADHLLVITPDGKIRSLERRLFGPQIEADSDDLSWNRLLSKAQLERYAAFYDAESNPYR